MTKEPHKHNYSEPTELKIPLRSEGKRLVGHDILKVFKCACGDIQAADIKERVKL